MSKYARLTAHLLETAGDVWEATFLEIEAVLGFALPKSAAAFPAWWANQEPPLTQTSAWVNAGWRTSDLDLHRRTVTFRRTKAAAKSQGSGSASKLRRVNAPMPVSIEAALRDWDGAISIDIRARFEWLPIGGVAIDHSDRLVFPKSPSAPGLYRFRLLQDGREARYFGETDNLARRFAHYRNPGPTQETNLRINLRFRQALRAQAQISAAIVAPGALVDFGDGWKATDFHSRAVRRFLENAAILSGGGVDIEVLNRGE